MGSEPATQGRAAGAELNRNRLVTWMEASGVPAAYVTDPTSIAYLTGFHAEPMERLMALAVRLSGATLIVPGIEADAASAAAAGVEVRGWRDGEDPHALVVEALGAARPRLAVETEHLTLAAYRRLSERVDPGEIVDATGALRELRLRKSPEELALLAYAAQLTDQVTERVLGRLRAGLSELQAAALLDEAIAEAGAQPSFPTLVQSGPNSAQPHLSPTARRIAPGDLVLLDFGAAWHGYRADTTRMAVVGEPTPRQREVHEAVLEAHDRAIAAVRAGVTAGAVDGAARSVLGRTGLGANFIHRTGHGIGLEAHEGPSLDPGSPLVLEPGMVCTIEPGAYLAGWGGVRIEDDVTVTEDGCRVLTQAAREPVVVPAEEP
ncbi:MAG: Xaa-Pro peptidase family protein [bacterium]|nr:Xaa-Pro peptidase family protein [bacterium]